ncbi:MAG: mandelate racemase/muconate lactonizing enzyme family protein [Acetobacterales bacterium]
MPGLKIESIAATVLHVPLHSPVRSSTISITHRDVLVCEATATGGATGTGWAVLPGKAGRAVHALLEDDILPLVEGTDVWAHERLWNRLWRDLHFVGPGGPVTLAIAAVDIALWDLRARHIGVPFHRLFGGARGRVPAYASAINMHLSLDELVAQTEDFLGQGYGAFKMKIGKPELAEDIERIAAVRTVIGPARKLYLDVNQAWSPGDAPGCLAALAPYAPGFIEEPMLSDDVAGHALLRRKTTVPVALGEQLSNKHEFWNYVSAGAADILQPNVWKVGGITEWLKVAHMAQHANLPVAPHAGLELSMHMCAAVQNGLMVERMIGGDLCDLGLFRETVAVEDGVIALPDRPGHGFTVDWDTMAPHALAGARKG